MASITEHPRNPRSRKHLFAFLLTCFMRLTACVSTLLSIAAIILFVESRNDPLMILFQPRETDYTLAIERSSNAVFQDSDDPAFSQWKNFYAIAFVRNEVHVRVGRLDDWGGGISPNWHLWRQKFYVDRSRSGDVVMVRIWLHTALFVGLLLVVPTLPITRPVRRFFKARKRAKQNRCAKCDYDLTGNESGICPECGKKI